MKNTFHLILRTLISIFKKIGNAVKVLILSIISFAKSSYLKVKKIIYAIIKFLWKYIFSYIFKFIYKTCLLLYLVFKKLIIFFYKLIKSIYLIIVISSKWLYRNIIIKIIRFLKLIIIKLYNLVKIINLFIFIKIIKPIYILIRLILVKAFKMIQKIFKYLIYKIFLPLIKFINRKIILKIINFIRFIFIKFYEFSRIISLFIFKKIIVPFYKFIRFILIKTFEIIQIIYNFLIFKIFVPTIKFIYFKIILNFVRFIKYIFIKLYEITKIISLFIFKNIIIPVSTFIRFVLIKTFEIIKTCLLFILNKIIIPVSKFIYKLILNFIRGFKFIFIKIYKVFKFTIFFIFDKFLLLCKKIIFGIRFLYHCLPNFVQSFFIILKVYCKLLIFFIVIELPRFLFYDLIKMIYKLLKFLIIKIFDFVKGLIFKIFSLLSVFLRKLKYIIKRVFDYILDYLELYYIILLSPLILLIFLVLFVISLFKITFDLLGVATKALIGKNIIGINEIIYFKPVYEPIKLLLKNLKTYQSNLQYHQVFAVKFKNIWYLSLIITAKIITPIFGLSFILLFIPVSIISKAFKKDKEIDKRLVVLDRTCRKLINVKNISIYGQKIRFDISNAEYNDLLEQFIVKNKDLSTIISIYVNDKLYYEKELSIKKDELIDSFILYNEIKNELSNTKFYKFNLPSVKDTNFIIKYEKLWNRDSIYQNQFTIRKNMTKTDVKILIYNLNNILVFDDTVTIKNIVNPSVLKLNKLFKLRKNETIYKYLPKYYSYYFFENPYINSLGKVIVDSDTYYTLDFKVNDLDTIYSVDILFLGSKKLKSNYISQINEILVSLKNSIFQDEITLSSGSTRSVLLLVNNKQITKDNIDLLNYELKKKQIFVRVHFMFNNKINVFKKVYNNKDYVSIEHLNYLKQVFIYENDLSYKLNEYQIKSLGKYKIIKFPVYKLEKIITTRFISLEKNAIKQSGLIKVTQDVFKFKVIFYKGLFKRTKMNIEIKIINYSRK